jgi:hypothetical protein
MDYASIRAWEIVREEIPIGEIDDYVAEQLGEPVIEFRACLSDYVTVSEEIAQSAIDAWIAMPTFTQALSGDWERIGASLDWGCPIGRGVALVVIFAGSLPIIES